MVDSILFNNINWFLTPWPIEWCCTVNSMCAINIQTQHRAIPIPQGHTGYFVLQHSSTMNRGVPSMSITVVPDSGTGELVGLSGSMQIIIEQGKHSYEFEYTLAERQ